MGEDDGAALMVGENEYVLDGLFEGISDGISEGRADGISEGRADGIPEGTPDGIPEEILVVGPGGATRIGGVGFCVVGKGVGAAIGVGFSMPGNCSLLSPLFPSPLAAVVVLPFRPIVAATIPRIAPTSTTRPMHPTSKIRRLLSGRFFSGKLFTMNDPSRVAAATKFSFEKSSVRGSFIVNDSSRVAATANFLSDNSYFSSEKSYVRSSSSMVYIGFSSSSIGC
mmetsp:Transcript_52701/g.78462  ORF Transcript_52701/g.78462 Transcript_52701/m.78462 type:complete len:225 (+) Transcript_52701:163-837(+)